MICFYGHRNGEYKAFSNFYQAEVTIDGKKYADNETYFQAMKTVDPKQQESVRKASSPMEAKKLGQKVSMRPDWMKVRYEVMVKGLIAKFTQHPKLKQLLLSTGDHEIHEDTSNDKIWGWGNGKGLDLLGKALMEVRGKLR